MEPSARIVSHALRIIFVKGGCGDDGEGQSDNDDGNGDDDYDFDDELHQLGLLASTRQSFRGMK